MQIQKSTYIAADHVKSLHLQQQVIHRLRSVGVEANSECPGYIQIGSYAFIHWHNDSKWRCHDGAEETDLKVPDSDDPATVANAILEVLKETAI